MTGWTLTGALPVHRGEIVSLVGGGGKTTAMFRLSEELAAAGWRVLSTTTTHLGREQSALSPHHCLFDPSLEGQRALALALERHRQVLVTGPPVEGGLRWGSVPADWVACAGADIVLVEADGARTLPFKAPAAHEPVVPATTTLLVPVVGIDAVGRPLQEVSHRPERVSALTGLDLDEPLDTAAIAAVLAHPEGGLKGRPEAARVRVLVNKVEDQDELDSARQLARHLLASEGRVISAVLIGAVAGPCPVRELRRRVAAVVLAAGRSTRMGGELPKQLLPWEGSSVLGRVMERLAACPLHQRLLVTGHRADEVGRVADGGVRVLHNPDYIRGEMLSSLQVGVRALGQEQSACLVVLGDQPWLEPRVVEALLEAYAAGPAGIVVPTFQHKRGHPVLIDRRYWPELLSLERGLAPRDLLQRHRDDTCLVPVDTDSILRDLDTAQDYAGAIQEL